MHLLILFVSGFLSLISGLISPMTKSDGTVDLASLLSHVTILEQTVSSLQTKTNQLETEIQSMKTELQATKVKLEMAEKDNKNFTSEIISLKDELADMKGKVKVTTTEVTLLKTDVTNIKKESVKTPINSTVVDSIIRGVISNRENLKLLQSALQDKTNTSDVNKTTVDTQQQQNELKEQMSKLASVQKQLLSTINSTVHDVSHIKDIVMTVQSQLITTKDEIIVIKTNIDTIGNESRTLQAGQQVIKADIVNISSTLKQVQSIEATTAASVNRLKENVRTMQSQINITTGDVNRVGYDVNALRSNLSTLEVTSLGNSQSLTQLSQTLALKTKAVTFHACLSDWFVTSLSGLVKFDIVTHNAGNGYNTTTGKFTAPVTGTYLFSAAVEVKDPHKHVYLYIEKSGFLVSSGYGETTSDIDDITIPVTAITHMKQGEEVLVKTARGVHLYSSDGSGYPTHFIGFLMNGD